MTPGMPTIDTAPSESDAPGGVRHRDAGNTRQCLLQAARRRFAHDGYAATTVRDIATDAGVNVALINRYFTSKEGLFEACLTRAVEELDRPVPESDTVELMLQTMLRHLAELPGGEHPLGLLLLLRSSGDESAERIRRNTFRHFAERLAAAAGWRPDDAETEHLMLRAQIALSVAFGIVLLRTTSGLEALSSASAGDLAGPLGDVFAALLEPAPDAHP
ncbi:TetR/AcrR family transcriptional regulator [Cryobacterium sp. MDB2-33-2]|uniref:TetR/AcrR family transcriptional regulator n=1 Tax=Cryobacterium sp. MDB2-33-2 TaxID=1259179 RepID=UPI0018E0BBB4|nr:TetR/AcrR family transcriptional regulator [Cryobacterium sp. MDB2-33-2]